MRQKWELKLVGVALVFGVATSASAFNECQLMLIEKSHAATVQRLFASSVANYYSEARNSHRTTSVLLAYLSDSQRKEFYELAAFPADKWDAGRVQQVAEKLNSWFPVSEKNPVRETGVISTSQDALFYFNLLGLKAKDLEIPFPAASDHRVGCKDRRDTRARFQREALDSFFWPDHGGPHVREILEKIERLDSLLTARQRQEFAFLLGNTQDSILWRQRLRLSAFLHDVIAISNREGHAYQAAGQTNFLLGELLSDDYVPIFKKTPQGFAEEVALISTISVLHSKSAIATDDLPRWEGILQEKHRLAFEPFTKREIFVPTPSQLGMWMLDLPKTDADLNRKIAKAGELLRQLDGLRSRGVYTNENRGGLRNTAGYSLVLINDEIFVDAHDLPMGRKLLPVPSSEFFHLYGQLVLAAPHFDENPTPTMTYPLLRGGERLKGSLEGAIARPEFRQLLTSASWSRSDLRQITSSAKTESVLAELLNSAFEYPRRIRAQLKFSFVRP